MNVWVGSVSGAGLREPLNLLERSLRDGEPLPNSFVSRLKTSIDSGDTEILAARSEGRTIGVLVLYYRLNVSLGGSFASIEDLYVEPEARRRGVGRALLEKAAKRCSERGISYVEAQVEEGEARKFYAGLGFEEEAHVRVFSRSYFLAET